MKGLRWAETRSRGGMEKDPTVEGGEAAEEQPHGRYDAFISYSHADARLAERLSRRIRTYRSPRALKLSRRRLQVFRDVERLTTGAELAGLLAERIDATRHLILLCSPDAARSQYVDQEVAAFLERKGRDALHVVMAQGDAQQSFPASLKAAVNEPLYIDLRPAGGWFSRWRRFREASLRLIAALLGVDYAELRREDQGRRRRRRNAAFLGILLASVVLGGAYLIDKVPADTWVTVPLPTDYGGSPLIPVREYAVYQNDPSILLYRAYGAEYAAQRPQIPIGIQMRSGVPYKAFYDAAREHLMRSAASRDAWEPLAVLRFELTAGAGSRASSGHGELRIFGFIEGPDDSLHFARALEYTGRTSDGRRKSLALPPTRQPDQNNSLEMDPWPAELLLETDLLPTWGSLKGRLAAAWGDGAETPLSYEIVDNEELFLEGSDGLWFERVLLSNAPDREISIGGERVSGRTLDEELWELSLADPSWSAYQPPDLERYGLVNVTRETNGERAVHTADGRPIIDESLLDQLEQRLSFEPDLYHAVTLVNRTHRGATRTFVTVVSKVWNEISETGEHVETLYLLRSDSDSAWRLADLQPREPQTVVIDLFALDDKEDTGFLVLTDREGLYESKDGGLSWRDFNFQETGLLAGDPVRTVCTGSPPAIYALLDRSGGGGGENNMLFRYQARDWVERLRVGLIELLGGTRA